MKESTQHISSQSLSTSFKDKMLIPHLKVAKIYAELSSATRLKCGAVLVTPDNTRVLMCGYNGTLPGMNNQCEANNITKDDVVHAEQNVLMACAKYGIKTEHCVLYCTHSPCIHCAKLIISAGIKIVVYIEEYRDPAGVELLKQNNIITLKETLNGTTSRTKVYKTRSQHATVRSKARTNTTNAKARKKVYGNEADTIR